MKTIIAAIAALLACAPIAAQSTATRTVTAADLRLDRPGDLARLDLRIARAAQKLCGPAPDWDLVRKAEAKRCRADALSAARTQRDRLVAEARRSGPVAATGAEAAAIRVRPER